MTVAVRFNDPTKAALSFQAFPKDGVIVIGLGNPFDDGVKYLEMTRAQAVDAIGVLATEIQAVPHNGGE